jgi:hypothetical protein
VEGEGDGICLEDDAEVPKYEATEREVTALCSCCKYTCAEESVWTPSCHQVTHTLTRICKSSRYFASVFSNSMRAWYLLKSSYLSSFFVSAAASRFCCCLNVSSSSSDPNMNDFRADFLRGLGPLGATEGRRRGTVGKSTPTGVVSSADEGVLTIGMPFKMTSLKAGEDGEPESCPGPRVDTGNGRNRGRPDTVLCVEIILR